MVADTWMHEGLLRVSMDAQYFGITTGCDFTYSMAHFRCERISGEEVGHRVLQSCYRYRTHDSAGGGNSVEMSGIPVLSSKAGERDELAAAQEAVSSGESACRRRRREWGPTAG